MIRTLSFCCSLFVLWLFWSGYYTPLLTAIGGASCLFVAYLCRRMQIIDSEGHPIEISLRLLRYLPWFFVAIIRSNLDVIKRILNPNYAISRAMVSVTVNQKTDLGKFIFANSITLTPGTVSIGVEDEHSFIVHTLTVEAKNELIEGEMGRKVARIEGIR